MKPFSAKMNEIEFYRSYLQASHQIMWFLGAGTSRTAGMPTASDLIWDLKLKIYCGEENQDIRNHDINNETIRRKIQGYMDGKGHPKLWSQEEYSFYFELYFKNDYNAQRQYLTDQLNPNKISLNIGHRVLGGLMELGLCKVIFTTNFDEVIEAAFAKISEKNLSPYHLEGSYAALSALNENRFPLYAKVHGDFKYEKVKNLRADLIKNDKEIQDCFLSASTRNGLIVSGYSGRDQNVMEMFNQAIEQRNPFPFGLFWTVTSLSNILPCVSDFIEIAQQKGINAHIVETGTFDSMLSKIWRQTPNRTDELDKKVRTATAMPVLIPFERFGSGNSILRTNALPVLECPKICAEIITKTPLSYDQFKQSVSSNRTNSILTKTDKILGWGKQDELMNSLPTDFQSIQSFNIDDPFKAIATNTQYKAFYERAIVYALANNKPLKLRNDGEFYLVASLKESNNAVFIPLKEALKDRSGNLGIIGGRIPNASNVFWSEAVTIKLEERGEKLWLMIRPTIWVEPSLERRNHAEFLKMKNRYRYNPQSNELIDAWIGILFGAIPKGEIAEIGCYADSEFPANFKISSRTTYSRF